MTASERFRVTYGRDADAYTVAHAANKALEGAGCRVMVVGDGPDSEVWICRRNEPVSKAVRFSPGQRLITMTDDSWRVEAIPAWLVTS